MENIASKEGNFEVDLEKGIVNDELSSGGRLILGTIRMNQPSPNDGGTGFCKSCVNSNQNKGLENVNLVVVDRKEGEKKGGDCLDKKKVVKEKPKAMSAKKPPKPPRPPRGLSLDSTDQKLIRELHELAKLKRARIERMKALKKAKEAKAASSSKNHLFGTLLTVLFCLVLIFQGISSKTSSAVKFQGSPILSGVTKDNIISIQHMPTSSASYVNRPDSRSPRLVEPVSGTDAAKQGSMAAG